MNFADVQSLVIPEGDVIQILSGGITLWSKPSPPGPTIELPPSNEIWYQATSQITNNFGSPTSHSYDSETGRGVLTYSSNLTLSSHINANAFKNNGSLQKIWWPASMTKWVGDCMHSCGNLKEIYAGSGLMEVSNGTCNGGTSPTYIHLVDNTYFYENDTGLVLKSDNVLYLGTYNLDIRNTPCTTLGNRCMADQDLAGATLYFPDTMTGADGDWYIGSSQTFKAYTIYLPCTTAPNWTLRYIRGAITWHIPAVNSGYESWKTWTGSGNWTFIEDL